MSHRSGKSVEISSAEHIKRFLFAGKAKFTLVSKETGTRFTYRVTLSKDGKVFFVNVLTGPDNDTHYSYAGIVSPGSVDFRLTKKSKFDKGAQSVKVISWYLKNIGHEKVGFYHAGKCGKCGRTLTVDTSIDAGMGPVCANRLER